MDWREFSIKMALRLGPALLIIISFLSLMIGIILHGISINEVDYSNPPATHFKPNVVIDEKLDDNLMWFLQVTDLHLSNRGAYQRERDFVEFCDKYVDIFKPDAVLVTGDLTDGREPNSTFGTGQQLDEWQAYANAISKSESLKRNPTKLFDIRGNHDNFNVYRPGDPKNLYRQYSIMGKKHSRNYMDTVKKGDKTYSFIAVDEVQTPGVKMFNFIGVVKEEDISELKKFKQIAKDEYNSEYNIWFAHYPTSSLVSPREGLRNIIDGPYLCGHYHTIGNLVTQMHSTQQPGYAEVELGDWKHNRRVRLAAVDHQLFNFVDFGFREFPVALMTNPKKPEYLMPKFEPIDRIGKSTHIRVLAFTNATKIDSVKISIDGGAQIALTRSSEGPLWTYPWNPKDYPTGLHKVEIFVEDSAGQRRSYHQDFSLDHSKQDFTIGARILLRAYYRSYVMAIFYFLVIVCTFPLLILRLVSYNHNEIGLKRHYKGSFLLKLHQLSNIKRLFVPLFIIPIWMAVGPHFVGHLVDEAIGICFAWGILIDKTLVHTGITFNVGSIFLLFIHIPEVVLLSYQVNCSKRSLQRIDSAASLFTLWFIIHIAVVTMMQLFMGSLLYSGQGLMAILTSFPYVWCIAIYAYCWYQCTKLDKSDFSNFERNEDSSEQQPLTSQKARDDKSSASDQSTC